MTLTEFLLARIAEDKADASQTDKELGRWQREQERNGLDSSQGGIVASSMLEPESAFNPARVLAECEAKRRIVAECAGQVDEEGTSGSVVAFRVLNALALPYVEHPDYLEEWRS